jgi:hypothetical protein
MGRKARAGYGARMYRAAGYGVSSLARIHHSKIEYLEAFLGTVNTGALGQTRTHDLKNRINF